MRSFTLKSVYLLLALSCFNLFAQSLVEDANLSTPVENGGTFNETIKIISNSKKIFILTNNNQQLGPGDFISLALEDNLAARGVVGKVHQGQVGVKILKIYSLSQWGKLKRDQEVQIIKGDDSLFGKKAEPVAPKDDIAKIKSEEDLYTGDVVANDDLEVFEENKNRHIRPDNIVALTGAMYKANEIKSKGGEVGAYEYGLSWAYQITDNYFVEGLYGRAMLDNFPDNQLQTLVNHFTVRLKFNIKGPLYTFFMPYLGYHTYTVSSPDAGNTNNQIQKQQELDAIDELKKSGPVFGVTVLRRLVPGWFVKGDLGTDVINLGFAIEF